MVDLIEVDSFDFSFDIFSGVLSSLCHVYLKSVTMRKSIEMQLQVFSLDIDQ